MTARRRILKSALGVCTASTLGPTINFGRYQALAETAQKYSSRVLKLVERSLVIDMHSGDRTTLDAIENSSKAIAITHSNCRALNNHPRLKTDEAIKKLAGKGGVMGITGVRNFVRDKAPTTVEHIVDHIDYVVKLVGIEHVSIGAALNIGLTDQPPTRKPDPKT